MKILWLLSWLLRRRVYCVYDGETHYYVARSRRHAAAMHLGHPHECTEADELGIQAAATWQNILVLHDTQPRFEALTALQWAWRRPCGLLSSDLFIGTGK